MKKKKMCIHSLPITAVHPQPVILVSEHKDLYDEQDGCYNSKEITDNKGSVVRRVHHCSLLVDMLRYSSSLKCIESREISLIHGNEELHVREEGRRQGGKEEPKVDVHFLLLFSYPD